MSGSSLADERQAHADDAVLAHGVEHVALDRGRKDHGAAQPRMRPQRGDGVVVVVAPGARRRDDGELDAMRIHGGDQLLDREVVGRGVPRIVDERHVAREDMHVRIDQAVSRHPGLDLIAAVI